MRLDSEAVRRRFANIREHLLDRKRLHPGDEGFLLFRSELAENSGWSWHMIICFQFHLAESGMRQDENEFPEPPRL